GTWRHQRILRRMYRPARRRARRVTLSQARYSHHTRTGPTASESCGAFSTKLAATGFNLFFYARSLIARNPPPGEAFSGQVAADSDGPMRRARTPRGSAEGLIAA